MGIGPGLGLLDFIPLLRASGGDDLSSRGTTSRGSSLQTKITAQIVERLPNGNFVIEGKHSFTLNGENQQIYIRGVVRPDDIDGNNQVLSTQIADAEISAIAVEKDFTDADSGANVSVEFFDVDFVAFGNAVLFAACFDDCESHMPVV